MATTAAQVITPEEYLERERQAETKSEYLNGEVFAMAGGTPDHSLIAVNIAAELRLALKGSNCRSFSSDLRLRVTASGLYTYADVAVICGKPQFTDNRRDTVTNPVAVAEVLSDSTKNYDRGQKFQLYRALTSLAEYLTVAQDAVHIEQWTRQPNGQWLLTEHKELAAAIHLPSLGIHLPLSGIYEKVEFLTGEAP